MRLSATETEIVHDDDLTRQIAMSLHRRHGRQVRDLKIFRRSDGLILHGQASTYYGKQLAQHVAMKLHGLPIAANEIEVC